MNGENPIHMNDVVVLIEDTLTEHFETGQPLWLRRGQVGTVVMTYDGSAFEVEFAGRDGRAYALLPVPAGKLLVLRDAPELAAA
jgi:hypothetical protein